MRVANVVHQYPPNYFTGTEQYAHAVGRALAGSGVDVGVFCLDPDFRDRLPLWRESRDVVDGLAVTRHGYWAGIEPDWEKLEHQNALAGERFAAFLEEYRPDIVHVYHLRLLGANLIDRALEYGARVVVSLMDFWWLCPRITMMKPSGEACGGPLSEGADCIACNRAELLDRNSFSGHVADALGSVVALSPSCHRAYRKPLAVAWRAWARSGYLMRQLRKADVLLAPTAYLAELYRRNGAQSDRVVIAPYGVDVSKCRSKLSPSRARPLTFGFYGTLSEHKGPRLIVDALREVVGECALKIWGRASDFPAYSRPLAAAAAEDPRVELNEAFKHEALPVVLSQIDVLVVPSLWHENSPFVVLEAQSAGLPVIVSNYGGLSEVVRDGVDGDLFEAGDVSDLARCMQRMIDDSARLERYRQAVKPPPDLSDAVGVLGEIYSHLVTEKCGVEAQIRGKPWVEGDVLGHGSGAEAVAHALRGLALQMDHEVETNVKLWMRIEEGEAAVAELHGQVESLVRQLQWAKQQLGS